MSKYINEIVYGDCLEKLKEIESDSIDCICTDPPYALTSEEYKEGKKFNGGFMNKKWDSQLVSIETWKECLRVLKSGAFAFIMCTPRQDVLARQIINLQDAGFKTNFSHITWTFASGFPKSANTTKLLEKRNINKEELNGSYLGFQPKPALETILVVMKPLSQKSFVDQALQNQKGITWLDDCRIPFQNENEKWLAKTSCDIRGGNLVNSGSNRITLDTPSQSNDKGRFPANLCVSDDSLNDGKIRKSGKFENHHVLDSKKTDNIYGDYQRDVSAEIDKTYGDSGSYSRYFDLDKWYEAQFIITPKASASERNKGLEDFPTRKRQGVRPNHPDSTGKFPCCDFRETKNNHPTVKPIKLMSYLITMGSRENDIILDPFCGSGTTCIAAYQLNRNFIGIELQKEYVDIAMKRLESYTKQYKINNFY